MKLLLDTNVFLEILLEQERAAEARTLLKQTSEHEFFLSDFSLHSIGLLLFRQKFSQLSLSSNAITPEKSALC